MKKKENVYVVIDTPKKAKKIKKVLDMFGENIYEPTNERLINCILSNEYPVINFNDYWLGACESIKDNKTEVSIKELRNLLAIEHLKEGDVVVVDNNPNGGRFILKLTGKRLELFEHNRCYCLDNNHLDTELSTVTGGRFLRYATEEEKALLEDKPKSIEVGKWYTFAWSYQPNDVRGIYFIEKVEDIKVWFSYGIDFIDNEWQTKDWYNTCHVWKEATKEEVEQALIKEAKKRYKVGDKVKSLVTFSKRELVISSLKFNNMGVFGDLWVNSTNDTQNSLILRNGKWAEIVEHIKPVINGKDLQVVLDGKPLRCESSIGKRVRVIDGGNGATGCNGQTGIIVDKPKKYRNGSLHPVIYVKLDNGHTWGLAMDHKIEYLQESSPLKVSLEIKDIATLQVIQKTLKELEEKLTKLI